MINHYEIKQVIILRSDLNYGTQGKKIVQACHASMGALLSKSSPVCPVNTFDIKDYDKYIKTIYLNEERKNWLEGSFAKICLKVDSEEELIKLSKIAEERKLPFALITDNGSTVFKNEDRSPKPTITALGIGPTKSEIIDEITGYLKLL